MHLCLYGLVGNVGESLSPSSAVRRLGDSSSSVGDVSDSRSVLSSGSTRSSSMLRSGGSPHGLVGCVGNSSSSSSDVHRSGFQGAGLALSSGDSPSLDGVDGGSCTAASSRQSFNQESSVRAVVVSAGERSASGSVEAEGGGVSPPLVGGVDGSGVCADGLGFVASSGALDVDGSCLVASSGILCSGSGESSAASSVPALGSAHEVPRLPLLVDSGEASLVGSSGVSLLPLSDIRAGGFVEGGGASSSSPFQRSVVRRLDFEACGPIVSSEESVLAGGTEVPALPLGGIGDARPLKRPRLEMECGCSQVASREPRPVGCKCVRCPFGITSSVGANYCVGCSRHLAGVIAGSSASSRELGPVAGGGVSGSSSVQPAVTSQRSNGIFRYVVAEV